jgi:hypothetical protein
MNLSEALEFARQMSNAEDVSFATQVTITCEVEITMRNTPETGVGVILSFPEFEGISLAASVDAQYVALPSADELVEYNRHALETGEGSIGLPISSIPVTLSADEVCQIFNIPANADWEMTNHGTLLEDR